MVAFTEDLKLDFSKFLLTWGEMFSVRQFSDSPSFPKSERNNSQRKLRETESIHSIITALCVVMREVSEERSIADLQGLEVVFIRLPHTQP